MAQAQDERRIVTALFADVAGSTGLSERLDPEEAKLILGEAIGRAIRAVEAYGGTISNLMGDGLLAVFGAPVAHEDDPERAVRAGLEIVAAARDYADQVRRSWAVEGFAMRVGIHTGEVVVGMVGAGQRVDYGVIGDTINTAARLEAAATGVGILVSEVTYRQVAARFEWDDGRLLELRGKAQSLRAFAPQGIREATPLSDEAPTPMVGREGELATTLELLERCVSGQGAVLFIVGDPGIGKSRFLNELRRRAISAFKCSWIEGRCVSYGESLPYWPYRDLLRNWLDVGASDPELRVRIKLRRSLDALFGDRVPETYPYLAAVLGLNLEPDAAAHLSSLSPESLQFRTFEVFTELLERMAANHPTVICLDDMHWADPTSLALTERLLGLTEGRPIMLTIGQRLETDHASWQLKENASREYRHLYRELTLHRLDAASQIALLSSLAEGRSLPVAVIDRLRTDAEGNPLYLEQLLRSLIDSGALVAENSHWTLRAGETVAIPQTLESVILARIDRLQPPWRDVLTSASVLGRTFGLELIQAVTGRAPSEVRQAIHHLLRRDLLQLDVGGNNAGYRFKHAIIQKAAYHTLVGPKRALLHRRAAEWYETYYRDRLDRVYGLIAHHWAETEDREKATHYLRLAGDRALADWAIEEAVDQYQALVPLLESAGRMHDAAELLFQIGTTLHLAMRYREANAAWQAAFARWAPEPAQSLKPTAGLRLGSLIFPWDPFEPNFGVNLTLSHQLYDRLLEGRPGFYVVPGLAIRWEVSDDGRLYRVELDPTAAWNDGTPFTSGDAVSRVRTDLSGPHLWDVYAPIENATAFVDGKVDFDQVGIRAVDGTTIEIRLRAPTPHWIFSLTFPELSGARSDGPGSGPFRISRHEEHRIILQRDSGYRRPTTGNVAEVEWLQVAADNPTEGILRGEIDIMLVGSVVSIAGAKEALSQGRLVAAVEPPSGHLYLRFSAVPPNNPDIDLRRALAHATNREALAEHLVATQIPATGGLVAAGVAGHTPDLALAFDPALARHYLHQSRHQGPVRIKVHPLFVPPYWDYLVDSWQRILNLQIETISVAKPAVDMVLDEVHAVHSGGGDIPPVPEHFLWQLHSRSPENVGGWSSPECDALIDGALEETSGARRLALLHAADRLAVRDQCGVIPLVYVRGLALLQPWVHGWWGLGPLGKRVDEVTVDERSPRFRSLD